MLYMPWGENNIFDYSAKVIHEAVDGRANVPFLGYSWLLMVLNVQFQMFTCFTMYAIFLTGVVRNFQRALDDFKALADDEDNAKALPTNSNLYSNFNHILKHRVKRSSSLQSCFIQTKLTLAGVDQLQQQGMGFQEFKLHLYFTDSLGKSLEYLVEVSLKSNVVLSVMALFIALLAHHFQVAFMYFLPLFI